MNTMEITKFVGAICGSFLIFLLIKLAAGAIYDTHSDVVGYVIEVGDEGGSEEAEAEVVDVAALLAEADAGKGGGVFKRCAACHKVDGSNAVGPHLDGVIDREKATVDGFSYSGALAGLGGAWDVESLFAFLASPKAYAPGTTMSFAGLSKETDRANVIAYLQSLSN